MYEKISLGKENNNKMSIELAQLTQLAQDNNSAGLSMKELTSHHKKHNKNSTISMNKVSATISTGEENNINRPFSKD